MIVLDASAWIDIARARASQALSDLVVSDPHWVVPEHFALEVLSALRGAHLGGDLDQLGFARAVRDLADSPLDVWPTTPLIPRIVQLTHDATTYDASYVALAEGLGCRLITADAKFARIPGIRCPVLTFSADQISAGMTSRSKSSTPERS
ncbi:MAG: type II toxin-antitoxin system VapC family toxin [Pseudolysinimonas sp.]